MRDSEWNRVGVQGSLADNPRYVGDVAVAFMCRLEESVRRGKPAGIPSGFRDLDHMTGGFGQPDFVVIAGRPSMGKTALMVSVAERATREGHSRYDPPAVLFVSLEAFLSRSDLDGLTKFHADDAANLDGARTSASAFGLIQGSLRARTVGVPRWA